MVGIQKGPMKKGTLQVKRAELLFGARGAGFVSQSHSPLPLSDYIKVPGNCRSLLPLR